MQFNYVFRSREPIHQKGSHCSRSKDWREVERTHLEEFLLSAHSLIACYLLQFIRKTRCINVFAMFYAELFLAREEGWNDH
jgi:hypothetical protein